MSEAMPKTRRYIRRKILFATIGTLIALGLSFVGWVYKAKMQSELNVKLLTAVKRNDTTLAISLLKRGAEPNIRDVPPHRVSLWQQVSYAFDVGKPVDSQYPTALEIALGIVNEDDSDEENFPLANALLEAGARPDDWSETHITPLMRAVSHGRLGTVQALLDRGANTNAHDDRGMLPIHNLTSYSSDGLDIAELLVTRSKDANAADFNGATLLMNAINRGGDIALVRFLIAQGADVNLRSKDGTSALLVATASADTEATRLLLEHGADPNVHDNNKKSPLGMMATAGLLPVIELLLAHGAKVDPVDNNGDTPLTACLGLDDRRDIVKVLIAHGADVNHRNNAGETALSRAMKERWTETSKLLQAAGATQ